MVCGCSGRRCHLVRRYRGFYLLVCGSGGRSGPCGAWLLRVARTSGRSRCARGRRRRGRMPAGDDRDLLFEQQAPGELFVVEAGAPDRGEGVEGAVGLVELEAHVAAGLDHAAGGGGCIRRACLARLPRRCEALRRRRTARPWGPTS